MTKICICDLDGVVADSSARFAKAEETKQRYYEASWDAHGKPTTLEAGEAVRKDAEKMYWRTAFTPDLVQLDTLMDGVIEILNQLGRQDYQMLFLASRPETMREATRSWLKENGIVTATRTNFWHSTFPFPALLLKPLSQQYVKTPVWKAGTIEVLARVLGVDDLLVIDDEHAAQLTADLAHLDCLKVMCCTSLATALRAIGE